MSGRKALFFDIDGTLISEADRVIPKSAKQAILQARRRGHLVFINSGRTYCLIRPVMGEVEADGYCCGCGTRVLAGDEVLFSATIPRERGKEIRENIIKYHLDGILEGTEGCYFQKHEFTIPGMREIYDNISREGNVSPHGWDEEGYDFDKFCVLADSRSDTVGFFRSLGLDFTVIDRGNGFYECVPAGCSKATAIDVVLKRYGLTLKDAYVFGDSTNDLPMFEYAKNCILMGRHDVELEPYATFFTKNVENDGIEYAMKKLKLID